MARRVGHDGQAGRNLAFFEANQLRLINQGQLCAAVPGIRESAFACMIQTSGSQY